MTTIASKRVGRRWGVVITWALAARLAFAAVSSAVPVPVPGTNAPVAAPNFFGLTNLWTIQLTVSAADWDLMGSGGGPRRQQFGGNHFEVFGGNGGGAPPENSPPPGLLETLIRGLSGVSAPTPAPVLPNGNPGLREGRIFPGDNTTPKYPWATGVVEVAGQTLTNVGLRFKGVSSMVRAPNGYKRPFKLDFDRGAKGRKFQGVGEFYLNNNVNDATQMREALAYEMFRQAGIAAPRTAFARVFLTIPGRLEKRHLGLYTVVEAVEGAFLERALGTKKGLLMKPEMMSGVQYMGDDWSVYRERFHPEHTPGEIDPAVTASFIEFLRLIQQTEPARFAEAMKKYLDPEAFGRFVAINAILANVDSFIGNGHNYYLHVHPNSRRVTFIPWDLNESFGMHPVSGPSGEQMMTSALRPNADPNQLVERWVTDTTLGRLYRGQCAWVLTNLFVPTKLGADIDQIAAVTRPVVFAESARAKADFERTVLGTVKPEEGDLSQPRFDREYGREQYRPWNFPDAVEIDNLPLKAWIRGRYDAVREQLEGRGRGTKPRARLFQQ